MARHSDNRTLRRFSRTHGDYQHSGFFVVAKISLDLVLLSEMVIDWTWLCMVKEIPVGMVLKMT